MNTDPDYEDLADLPEQTRRILRQMPGYFLLLASDSPRFTIVEASDAFVHAMHIDRRRLVGQGLFELFPGPEETVAALRASFDRALSNERVDGPVRLRRDVRRANFEGGGFDERHWSAINAPILGANGQPAWLVHRVEEICSRDRREGEDALPDTMRGSHAGMHALSGRGGALGGYQEMLESIISTAADGIITIDSSGTIQVFNPAAERIFGYRRAEVIGRNVAVLMPAEIGVHHAGYIQRYFETGEAKVIGFGREVIGRHKDGHSIPLEIRVGPFDDGHFSGFLRDVSPRKRLEAEYLQAQKMEAIGRLAGGVAHDFNNLLAGLQSGVRIALDSIDGEHPSRTMLREVQEEIARGAAITRRLLDFSRIQQPAPRALNPCEVISASERMIRRLLGEDIEVRTLCQPSETRVVADPAMIEQILLNLAINARDAMPAGGSLEIGCKPVELDREALDELGLHVPPGPFVRVTVIDDGCGMSDEVLTRATEAFFTTKDPGLGTGLGLSTVAAMVRGWNGALRMRSAPGDGTCVEIFLPGARGAEVAEACAPRAEPDEAVSRGERILVVEDEKLVRMGIEYELRECGYRVQTAKDASDALDLLDDASIEYDLLLTDVVLPGMSGPELAHEAIQRRPGLRTLMMSAFPLEELVARGRVQPGAMTLEKPFTTEQLRSTVRRAIEKPAET